MLKKISLNLISNRETTQFHINIIEIMIFYFTVYQNIL